MNLIYLLPISSYMRGIIIKFIFLCTILVSENLRANTNENDQEIKACKNYYQLIYQERLRNERSNISIEQSREILKSLTKRFCRKRLPYETSDWFELYLEEKENSSEGYNYGDFYLLCLKYLNESTDYNPFTFCNDIDFITRDKDKTEERITNIKECIVQNKDINKSEVSKACLKWTSRNYQKEKGAFRHCLNKAPEELYYGCQNSMLLSFIARSSEYREAFDYCMTLRDIDKKQCLGEKNRQDNTDTETLEKLTLLIKRKKEFKECYQFLSENDINSNTCFNHYTLDNWSSTLNLMERFCKARNTLLDSGNYHLACQSNRRNYRRGDGMTERELQKKSRDTDLQPHQKSFDKLCPVSCETISRAYEHCIRRSHEIHADAPYNTEECLETLNRKGVLLCIENHPSDRLRTFSNIHSNLYHHYSRKNKIGMPIIHPEFNECLKKPVYKYFVKKPEKVAQCIDEKIFNEFERFLNTESVMRCIPTLNILLDKFKEGIRNIKSFFQPNKQSNINHQIDDSNRSEIDINQETIPQVQPTGYETVK